MGAFEKSLTLLFYHCCQISLLEITKLSIWTNLISDERGQETKDGVDLVRGRDERLVLERVLGDEDGESFATVKVEQLE